MKLQRIRSILAGLGAVMLRDLDASKARSFLDARAADRPTTELPPEPEWYTLGEASKLAGISKHSIGLRITRDGLKATGNGKARRLHRDALVSILASQSKGISTETYNQHIVALRSFGRWLADNERAALNPFRQLRQRKGASADQRHTRAPLTVEELQRLLTTTRASKRLFRGLDGEARFMLYAVASRTGLRAAGLASLKVSSFYLTTEPPTVTLQASSDKSGRGKLQPIPNGLAQLLSTWLAGRPPGGLLWPGSWASDCKAGLMLQRDLKDAGLPYKADVGGQVVHRDFHSLKHFFVSEVSRASGDERATRLLASHTSSEVTARYDHRQLVELARKLEGLPPLLPDNHQAGEDRRVTLLRVFQSSPGVPFDALPYPF
ncbi:MAG: tyrosine-type recombinase/integrase [Gemmataceae bacterium]